MNIKCNYEIQHDENHTPEEILDILLKIRNIQNAKEFLSPRSPLSINLVDFEKSYKSQFKKVVKLLKSIKEKRGKIIVYTDYDADGITGGAILWETLYELGFDVLPYVPHRIKEGYGFSKQGIEILSKEHKPLLIISVDHGITAAEKISYAKSLGIPIVVTDHHSKGPTEPTDAFALFHIPQLSGSGVAYFFAKEICKYFNGSPFLTKNFETDYLLLAAIGTVADLVPLVGPSRSIVKSGLAAFPNVKRVGIRELCKQAGILNKPIDTYEIGFMIAPRINAIGRLEHALDALRLLCTKDEEKARSLCANIGVKNTMRQDLVQDALIEAEQIIEKNELFNNKIVILTSETWHEGIIGLIASKLLEKYYRPIIVITKSEKNYKGSGRSPSYFHLTDFLRKHRSLLVDVGGHKQAAGFSVTNQKLMPLRKQLVKDAEKIITDDMLVKSIETDMRIPVSHLSIPLIKKLTLLAPFGVGNPKPSFASTVAIKNVKRMGKKNNHIKFFSQNGVEFVGFGKADMAASLHEEEIREVIYNPELNTWGGMERITAKVIHF